ncbi:cytidylyltransferase domain-containing protein [Tamlana sp. I1]|uniref:acylneuraminate cytidylyltransferase family protein n=1 Tax=Tamlana sp. I1 TaxID=2762061 RepID=UPI00188E650A|nr:acylneuraminate cytidylyltransferase family protein [Tamlana sp. I1]
MKILAVIPARGGSKGVPNKNIKKLGKKPLIQYTTDVAVLSKYISKLIVSSDDDAIIAFVKSLGVAAPFKRPAKLATDKAATLPVIQHVLEFLMAQGETFDAVCILQPTSPFRTTTFLDAALEQFMASKTDSLVSVQEVPHEYNPHWTFKVNDKNQLSIATGDETIISRRQDLPKAYHRDGSIYITKTEVLLKQNSLYGNSINYIESPKSSYINIDTMADWERAEEMIQNNLV